jgi:DNA gyrase subunit B
VNGIKTVEQGSHMQGFSQALKAVGWKPELSLIHVVMHDPKYAGPTRTKLDAPHIRKVVKNALQEPLRHHLEMNK